MGNFDTLAKKATRHSLQLTGQPVTYRGSLGSVSTVAVLNRDIEFMGDEISAGDVRWVCSFPQG